MNVIHRAPTVRLALQLMLIALTSFAAVAGLFAVSPGSASAAGTTYYFSTSGSDSNNGLSAASPKKNVGHALTLMSAGNTILFKRGDAWYNTTLDLQSKAGTLTSPITIGAYGTGAKPVIAGMDILNDAGWTNISGTNRWRHTYTGYTNAERVFANGVPKQRVGSASAVDQLYEWAMDGTYIYLYTGSPTVGPKNVETIPVGRTSTALLYNTHFVTITDIDFRGGSNLNVIYTRAPSSHITFDNLIVQRAVHSGILAQNETGAGNNPNDYVSHLTITNSLIDKVWEAKENETETTEGDGVFLRHAVDGAVVRGNKIINWGHSGIAITSYAEGLHGVKRVIAEQNDVSAGISGYMHALDMNGFAGLTQNNIIRRNYFHDYTTTSHILGGYNKIYGNIFAGLRATVLPGHSVQPYAMDLAPWHYNGSGPFMEAKNTFVVNNTVMDTEQYSIVITDEAGNPNPVTNNIIGNNIFGDYGTSYRGEVAINVGDTVAGDIYVRNNAFYDNSSVVARYKNPSTPNYTATQLNTTVCPTTCSGNEQLNPLFADEANRDYRLTSGSPGSAKTGANNYDSIMGSGYTDFFGTPFDPNGRSMGAIQYPGATRSNLASGIAPTFSTIHNDTTPSKLTNGNTSSSDNVAVGNPGDIAYAQIDLGALKDVSQIKMWHYYTDGRTYKDVIVQLSQTPDFSSYVTTVFNNDQDNSAGQGSGSDATYAETSAGKTLMFAPVTARYARFWLGGNSVNGYNHFVELQVFGTEPISKLVSQYRDITYNMGDNDTYPSKLTDGDLNSANYVAVGGTGAANAVIDLGVKLNLTKIKMWHYYADSRKYRDVIVQISDQADFSTYTTVFNNDTNNSAGQGTGTDAEYNESSAGKTVTFSPVNGRYVRFWVNGSTANAYNHFVELEVYGY
ncbi:discoidin domain-containing protein [Paenibacillus koleovorans]|uniref:discoidin domain-containing protein n=1 Tax=Paenibacillus koleovorans TaxID=121608 RepID=UPI000FD8E21B|nr:discoidin domain-containing protein [Paenibacillus koleovorans]